MSIQFIQNSLVLVREPKHGAQSNILENDWVHCLVGVPAKGEAAIELTMDDLPKQKCSVPLSFWLKHRELLLTLDYEIAVQVAGSDKLIDLLDNISEIKTIVLTVATAVDGRSYSHAYLLKTRHGFTGEIRVIGDVHHDQLNFLARSGCNAFELPEGESLEIAQQAFNHFSDVYQPSADGAPLIFSRRRAIH